ASSARRPLCTTPCAPSLAATASPSRGAWQSVQARLGVLFGAVAVPQLRLLLLRESARDVAEKIPELHLRGSLNDLAQVGQATAKLGVQRRDTAQRLARVHAFHPDGDEVFDDVHGVFAVRAHARKQGADDGAHAQLVFFVGAAERRPKGLDGPRYDGRELQPNL